MVSDNRSEQTLTQTAVLFIESSVKPLVVRKTASLSFS